MYLDVTMYSHKKDVDRHVEYCLKKIQSETERNLRSLAFAKLYFNISEHEQARRYVSTYLVAQPRSAEAHLLLGKVLEKLGRKDSALESYRTSLDIEPNQKGLILKVCELLGSDDVTLDSSRARYWCEQAKVMSPHDPAVFNLRKRLASTEIMGPEDVRGLFVSELEHRPTDIALRVRLLQHMLDNNQLAEAYQHAADIEEKNLAIFAQHLTWYETVAKVLVKYKNENNSSLSSQFWMLIVSVFDKLVGLSLDENVCSNKNTSDCVRAIFNFDQILFVAAENVKCPEKQFSQEFLIHFRAQLCFHIATLVFKLAKKDQLKYKEASNLALPLLLLSYHSSPVELHCVWLEHAEESTRKLAQRWHREASYRCSQAGHTLQSVKERRSTFSDHVAQLSTGSWRERTYKNIFITRDQQQKIKSSYFVTCPQLTEVLACLPNPDDQIRFDETAQLVHPSSLHHMIWIGLNTQPAKFRCTLFDGLQYSVKNLSNNAAENLSILDIQAFINLCVFCAQSSIEESKHMIYYNREKPKVLPASITESYGTINQTKWYISAYKMYTNDCGSNYSDIRMTLMKGIEIVRCHGPHGIDVKLLVMLANTFTQRSKQVSKPGDVEYNEARAELYWNAAIPMLDKLKNNQIITYPAKRWFEYKGKDMTPTEVVINIEEGKLFSAVQLMKKKEHERALDLLSSLKSPYASYYQAQTYKLLADEQMSHNKENVTSEMRSQHIIMLSKARDSFYLTLDRLREPSVDRKHPLNAELGTEIEKIERLLSRIDPDMCVNRNECDGMSDENVSSVGSVGDNVNTSSTPAFMHHTINYVNGNMSSNAPLTPRHDHTFSSTPFRSSNYAGAVDHSYMPSSRREARPSPERLDAQLRQIAAAKDATLAHILEQTRMLMDAQRALVEEIRGLKDSFTTSVDGFQDDLRNLKMDINELKKDTNKLKSTQINEEDLYVLEEEYGVDYNINPATSFNTAAGLYPNFPQRLPGALQPGLPAGLPSGLQGGLQAGLQGGLQPGLPGAYGAPGLYGMYPMYPFGGLGLGQPGALPFPEGVPDFRGMGSIAQGLSHTGLAQTNQPSQLGAPLFGKLGTDHMLPSNLGLQTPLLPPPGPPAHIPASVTSYTPQIPPVAIPPPNQIPPNKAPDNVVITASDPLPTTTVTTSTPPILSVTIPPQHLKGNQHKPHNYQISLPPAASQNMFSNVHSVTTSTPPPVATQNLLTNVAPPVYSSLTVKSPGQPGNSNTNKTLGLQIEKSLTQSFSSNAPNTSLTKTMASNTSNISEGSFVEEHDPCPDFKPIIPLPDEVPLNTGEENEKILFCEHAKLYRYVEKEWKERGVGDIKILYNEKSGKVRLLMRRDQVHKICANHFITADIQLSPMSTNTCAYIWAANDFADQNVILEKLCVKFKTPELGKKFSESFEKAKNISKIPSTPEVNKQTTNFAHKENLLGGFVFTSTPTFKPKTDAAISTVIESKNDSTAAKPSPFAGFTFNTPKTTTETLVANASEFKPVQKVTETSIQAADSSQHDEADDDFTPTIEFKPVISLPDLVEIKTGEENSEVLFEVKAKLLRYDSRNKEWKERGVGIIKILKDQTVRLLMRREQVHKVCCNHQLLKDMVFTYMPQNNKVLNWCAQDYSENTLKTEMFAIRFRTPELCDEFLEHIHKAQAMLDTSNNVSNALSKSTRNTHSHPSKPSSTGFGEAFKAKAGSWECGDCYVSNDEKNKNCIACGSSRGEESTESDSYSPQRFKPSPALTTPPIKENKPKIGMWLCKVCYIHNDGKNKNCEACDSPKTELATPVATTPAVASDWGDLYKPKVGAWNCAACYLSNDGSAIYCVACESPKDNTIPKKDNKGGLDLGGTEQTFSFGIPATSSSIPSSPAINIPTVKPSTESQIFGFKSQPTAGFTFGMAAAQTTAPATGFTFGSKPATEPSPAPLNLAAKPAFAFSMNSPSELNILSTPKKDEFVFGSPNKHEFEFKPRSPRKVSGGDGDAESDGSCAEEECDNIYFKPVIPLPDKVEVKTGEEEEEVLYCHRAKLFRFINGEWKERGIGDVKILRHAAAGKLRVVMRREQVHKICLNHTLTKEVLYTSKDDKTWLFSAADYSEGEISYQQFCLRFKNAEIASQFMEAVNKSRDGSAVVICATTTTTSSTDKSEKKPEKSDSDSDVEIISVTEVSPELQEKALKLQLPKNFYAYLQKPPCKGCIGCNPDDFVFSGKSTSVTNKKVAINETTPKVDTTVKVETTANIETTAKIETMPNIFAKTNASTLFMTPNSTTSLFSSPNTTIFGTPMSSNSSTITPQTPTSNSYTITPQTPTPNSSITPQTSKLQSPFIISTTPNLFAPTTTSNTNSPSLFGTEKLIFGQTTITPVSKNDAPTLTHLLTQPSISIAPVIPQADGSKALLAPSKLGGTLTTNIFSGKPSAETIGSSGPSPGIFGNSTQIFGGGIKTAPVFGSPGNIFSGAKPAFTSNIFGGAPVATTTSSHVFGGNLTSAAPTFGATNFFMGAKTDAPAVVIPTAAVTTEASPFSSFSFTQQAAKLDIAPPVTTPSEIIKTPSLFGNATPAATIGLIASEATPKEPVFHCDTGLSFAALATTPGANNFTKLQPAETTKPFAFAGAGSLVFGGGAKTESKATADKKDKSLKGEEDEDGEAAEGGDANEEYDPHYEPIVPLPDAIEVKTGEEEEAIKYNERAKLYRYNVDSREWKERGVGQIKLLHHPVNDTYRLLMRREQVHKLVLNQLLTPTIDLQPMYASDRAWVWAGYNYSEDGNQLEQLAVRFKNREQALQFRQAVLTAQTYLSTKMANPVEVSYREEEDEEDVEHDDDEYGSEDSDENKSTMFEKRCTLSYQNGLHEWITLGMGVLKMFYDSELYGARIEMVDDSGEQLSNTIVATNTVMTVEDSSCIWRAMEWMLDPPMPRILKAQFSSDVAAQEMHYNFEEAVQYAKQSGIVDELPE